MTNFILAVIKIFFKVKQFITNKKIKKWTWGLNPVFLFTLLCHFLKKFIIIIEFFMFKSVTKFFVTLI